MHTNGPTNLPLNSYGDMVIFSFFKMAAVRHLGFVFDVTGLLTKHICWSVLLRKIRLESMQCFPGYKRLNILRVCLENACALPQSNGDEKPPKPPFPLGAR